MSNHTPPAGEHTEQDQVFHAISAKAERIKDRGNSITIRPGYVGLCFTCQHAFIHRTSRSNDPYVQCEADYAPHTSRSKPLDVVECNRYAKHGEIDLWDLARSTKILDLGIETKRMGFEGPKEG